MGNRDTDVAIPEVGTRVRVSGVAGDFFGQKRRSSNVTKIETVTRSVILPSDQVLSRLDGIESEFDSELICLYDLTVANIAPEPGYFEMPLQRMSFLFKMKTPHIQSS